MNSLMVEEAADEILEGVEREHLPAAVLWAEGEAHHLARSHFVVGVIWTILGRDCQAEQAFRKALDINSEDIATLLETARCLDRQGKATEAMIYAADAAIVAPGMPEVLDLLAILFLKCDATGRAKFARLQNLPAAEASNLTESIRSLFVKFTDREEESRG
jgi:tetratricopeptide (TPR) repeat protein